MELNFISRGGHIFREQHIYKQNNTLSAFVAPEFCFKKCYSN